MGQKISIEAALAAFRQRHGELADENILLKARVSELEEENARLREAPLDGQSFPADTHAEARIPGDQV